MHPQSIKSKAIKGVAWTLLEKLYLRLVAFCVTLVLARLLTPDDYGIIALLTIFTTIAGVIAESGLGSALIQKKDATELDFNSVFYMSLMLSGIAYLFLFALAPVIASFYKSHELIVILRVTSMTLVFNAVTSVQEAELNRKLLFHLSFRIALLSATTSAVVGILLAFFNFGPWALVWQTISNSFIGVISRWFIIAWRPRLMFSWQSVRKLFAYGWKLSVSSIIEVAFGNLSGLLIGKFYSRIDLSYVTKGQAIPNLAVDSLNGALGRVSFPILSQMQDSPAQIRESMRKIIRISTFFVFPTMTILAVCARPVVMILLGEQWINCVPYVQFACFQFALWPFHTVNLQGIKAMGRSDLYLKLEVLKKIIALIVILLTFRYGVLMFVAISSFVLGPLSVIINAWPNRRMLGYPIRTQILDVASTTLVCLLMAGGCWSIQRTGIFITDSLGPAIMLLSVQLLTGATIFLTLSIVFRIKPICELAKLLYPYTQNRVQIFSPLLRRLSETVSWEK